MEVKAKKAVFFDYDGTLVDTKPVLVGAYRHIAHTYGYSEPTVEELGAQFRAATPVKDIMSLFFPGRPVAELLALNSAYCKANAGSAAIFQNIIPLLQMLHDRDVPAAVITGGDKLVEELLQHYDIGKFFMSVVHCNRVQFAKPNPEGFLLAAEECGVLPTNAIMIGDSPNDILAGKNGRAAATIGVTFGHGSHADMQAVDADYIVNDALELHDIVQKLLAD